MIMGLRKFNNKTQNNVALLRYCIAALVWVSEKNITTSLLRMDGGMQCMMISQWQH